MTIAYDTQVLNISSKVESRHDISISFLTIQKRFSSSIKKATREPYVCMTLILDQVHQDAFDIFYFSKSRIFHLYDC